MHYSPYFLLIIIIATGTKASAIEGCQTWMSLTLNDRMSSLDIYMSASNLFLLIPTKRKIKITAYSDVPRRSYQVSFSMANRWKGSGRGINEMFHHWVGVSAGSVWSRSALELTTVMCTTVVHSSTFTLRVAAQFLTACMLCSSAQFLTACILCST